MATSLRTRSSGPAKSWDRANKMLEQFRERLNDKQLTASQVRGFFAIAAPEVRERIDAASDDLPLNDLRGIYRSALTFAVQYAKPDEQVAQELQAPPAPATPSDSYALLVALRLLAEQHGGVHAVKSAADCLHQLFTKCD